LDGYGILGQPSANAQPVAAKDFLTIRPSPATPPGLYVGPGGERSLNAGAPAPVAFDAWPLDVTVTEQANIMERRGLGGWLIGLALGIVSLDLLIALAFAGRFAKFSRTAAGIAAMFFVGAMMLHPPEASAQSPDQLAKEAAEHLRFAYVKTGDK